MAAHPSDTFSSATNENKLPQPEQGNPDLFGLFSKVHREISLEDTSHPSSQPLEKESAATKKNIVSNSTDLNVHSPTGSGLDDRNTTSNASASKIQDNGNGTFDSSKTPETHNASKKKCVNSTEPKRLRKLSSNTLPETIAIPLLIEEKSHAESITGNTKNSTFSTEDNGQVHKDTISESEHPTIVVTNISNATPDSAKDINPSEKIINSPDQRNGKNPMLEKTKSSDLELRTPLPNASESVTLINQELTDLIVLDQPATEPVNMSSDTVNIEELVRDKKKPFILPKPPSGEIQGEFYLKVAPETSVNNIPSSVVPSSTGSQVSDQVTTSKGTSPIGEEKKPNEQNNKYVLQYGDLVPALTMWGWRKKIRMKGKTVVSITDNFQDSLLQPNSGLEFQHAFETLRRAVEQKTPFKALELPKHKILALRSPHPPYETLLKFAIRRNHIAVFEMLFQNCPELVSVLDANTESVAHEAVIKNSVPIITTLYKNNIPLMNQASANGSTPFSLAIKKGKYDVVAFLASQPNISWASCDKEGLSVIYEALEDMCSVTSGSQYTVADGRKSTNQQNVQASEKGVVTGGKYMAPILEVLLKYLAIHRLNINMLAADGSGSLLHSIPQILWQQKQLHPNFSITVNAKCAATQLTSAKGIDLTIVDGNNYTAKDLAIKYELIPIANIFSSAAEIHDLQSKSR